MQYIPFGQTGHLSSRAIFGAAALGGMSQFRADQTLALAADYGLNHIDVAASYGEAELRLAPWLQKHRDQVFLATKTGQRTYGAARDELHASLERMQVAQIDLIQMHNLTQEEPWQQAMSSGGALEALVEAKEQGLVRFIGVTGHGTYCPAMHLRSLRAYDFDSVLVPFNFTMMNDPVYAQDFEALYQYCQQRGVAMQTIKAIAARRWRPDVPQRRFSWYRPITDPEAMKRAVDFVLRREDLFINTSSDATLLERLLVCIEAPVTEVSPERLAADVLHGDMEPIFVRGISDDVRVAE